MDLSASKVRKIMKIAQEPISLETPIGEEEDSHLGDFIEDKNAVSPVESVDLQHLREQTSMVLNSYRRARSWCCACASESTKAPSTRSRRSAAPSTSPRAHPSDRV